MQLAGAINTLYLVVVPIVVMLTGIIANKSYDLLNIFITIADVLIMYNFYETVNITIALVAIFTIHGVCNFLRVFFV